MSVTGAPMELRFILEGHGVNKQHHLKPPKRPRCTTSYGVCWNIVDAQLTELMIGWGHPCIFCNSENTVLLRRDCTGQILVSDS